MSGGAGHDGRDAAPSVADSLREYGRGLVGGLLFSLPLLYTMEVWWAGFIASPVRLCGMLTFTFVLLLGYNRFAGLRHDASWLEVAIDSVEELGLGILTAGGLLFLTGRIGPSISSEEIIGKIVVEAAIAAIGFSVGSAQLGSGEADSGKGANRDERRPTLIHQMVMAACGAVLFAANVAPTEEIVTIAVETASLRLAGLMLLSIGLIAGVLYYIGFKGADRFAVADHRIDVIAGTAITYAIALAAGAALLWFFGRFAGAGPEIAARQVAVLGLPSALGAATGRLLLQS